LGQRKLVKQPMIKTNLNKIIWIVATLVNVFFVGNTLFNAWSLIWPQVPAHVISEEMQVPGQPISKEIKIQSGVLERYNYKQYLFFITYEYGYGGFSYRQKKLIEVFDSGQICEAAVASYRNKTITVYVNPADPKFSVINPVNGFINAVVSTVLIGMLTAFLLYILTTRSNFSEGLSTSSASGYEW